MSKTYTFGPVAPKGLKFADLKEGELFGYGPPGHCDQWRKVRKAYTVDEFLRQHVQSGAVYEPDSPAENRDVYPVGQKPPVVTFGELKLGQLFEYMQGHLWVKVSYSTATDIGSNDFPAHFQCSTPVTPLELKENA